jgi:hypothetical protein
MNLDKLYFDLDKCEIDKWYWLHTNQYGKELMSDVVKLKIDNGGDFEFNEDYTKFRRIQPFHEYIASLDNPNGINIKFEFHNREDVFIDYSHLPEPKFRSYSKKEWEAALGRVQ